MEIITRITFIAKDPRNIKLRPLYFLLGTRDFNLAHNKAKELLACASKCANEYRSVTPIEVVIHSI